MADGMDAGRTIETDFRRLMEPAARRLLGEPNPRFREAGYLRYGTNGSLKVCVAGEAAGTFYDHEAGEGGGVLALVRRQTGLADSEAVEWLRQEVDPSIPAPLLTAGVSFGLAPRTAPPARPEPASESRSAPAGRIVATYDYRDAAGALLFQVVRMEPKTFRQRRPDGAGGWTWSVKGVEQVPYRLPELLAAPRDKPVFVVEGEKDADTLAALGLVATCNPGGAGKWRNDFGAWFQGRAVVVLPDNDPQAKDPTGALRWHPDGRPVLPGQDHAADVAKALNGAAASVRVLALPGLPLKGDVSDWLASGGTPDALLTLARASAQPTKPPTNDLPLLWFDEIDPVLEAKDFVQGVLAEGGASVVYGESNAGKTFWTTDLSLHVAAGKPWNGKRVDGGGVVYCVLEGGHGFRNRVAAWRKQHANGRPVHFAAIPVAINLLDPEADTPRLTRAIQAAAERMGVPVKLVVVDTLSRALAGGNENAPEDMGALVRNMDTIRAETGAALMFVHHSGKDAAKGARGHSLLRAAIDTEIEVKADEVTGSKTATVVKQRDLKKGDVFGFRLDVKTLGQNEHGEDVTTCIVLPEEAKPVTKGGTKPVTLTERGWLTDLTDMFADHGTALMRQPASGMDDHLTLTREQVRAGFRARGRFTCGPDGNLTGPDRERMRAVLTSLKDKGKIGLSADLVWLL